MKYSKFSLEDNAVTEQIVRSWFQKDANGDFSLEKQEKSQSNSSMKS